MSKSKKLVKYDQQALRYWTLYVVQFTDGHYYVGITSYRDAQKRIRQHGGLRGARVNRGKTLKQIIEVRRLGLMTGQAAGQIENNITLAYRKKYGARKVRGGYDTMKRTPLIPTYTPGSSQAYVFIIASLALSLVLLLALLSLLK